MSKKVKDEKLEQLQHKNLCQTQLPKKLDVTQSAIFICFLINIKIMLN